MDPKLKIDYQTAQNILECIGKQNLFMQFQTNIPLITNPMHQNQIKMEEKQNQTIFTPFQHIMELDSKSLKNEADEKNWTQENERTLFKYNNEFGNKWAKIASIMGIKNDNFIKNRFYCTLRKGMKLVEKFIIDPSHKRKYKPIKGGVLMKIFSVLEDRHKNKLGIANQVFQNCDSIKNRLINISNGWLNQQENREQIQIVIEELNIFNRSYKKKRSKRFHRGSIIQPKKILKNNRSEKQSCNNKPSLDDQSLESELIEQKVNQNIIESSRGFQSKEPCEERMKDIKLQGLGSQNTNFNFGQNMSGFIYPSFGSCSSPDEIKQMCKFIYDKLIIQCYSNLSICNQLYKIIMDHELKNPKKE